MIFTFITIAYTKFCSHQFHYIDSNPADFISMFYSLPADVRWGSFVTHSILPHGPWGRNECVTNEPQRTSAGRLCKVILEMPHGHYTCLE